jgi:hypothetical protein
LLGEEAKGQYFSAPQRFRRRGKFGNEKKLTNSLKGISRLKKKYSKLQRAGKS